MNSLVSNSTVSPLPTARVRTQVYKLSSCGAVMEDSCWMQAGVRLRMNGNNNFRYKNILASRGVPILFIIVCFLVIANTRCDQVGSANVQKFHPNGRYGRRSVDNIGDSEPHIEMARLNSNSEQARRSSGGDLSTLRAILNSFEGGEQNSDNYGASSAVVAAHTRSAPNKYTEQMQFEKNRAQMANYQLEMNKLLNCNYTGISNLYWCDTPTSSVNS